MAAYGVGVGVGVGGEVVGVGRVGECAELCAATCAGEGAGGARHEPTGTTIELS